MTPTPIFAAYKFFKANAGWATPPGRAACALALARAEADAADHDVTFVWEDDSDAYFCDPEGYEGAEEILSCMAFQPCECCGKPDEVVASLGGIADPNDDYRRVVEAELALEATYGCPC